MSTALRTYVCLPGAWMGAWSWHFVVERLKAAGHDARALPFRGVGERAAELSPACDNDLFLADTLATLERENLRDIVLVGHSFGSLIASLVTDRIPERIDHLVIIDGAGAGGQSIASTASARDRGQAEEAHQRSERHRSAALRAGRQPDHRRSRTGGMDAPPARRIRSPATPSRSTLHIPRATAGR